VNAHWDLLAKLVRAGDWAAVAEFLLALDEPARRALAPELRRYLDLLVADWHRRGVERNALLVAGTGCLPRAADVVSWLRSRWLRGGLDVPPVAAIVQVLGAPGRPALATVARGLAERVRTVNWTGRNEWWLAAALLRESGAEPPTTDAFLRGWVRGQLRGTAERLADTLAGDPWTALLAPRIFDVERLGADLAAPRDPAWPQALVLLCERGVLDRAEMLAGCRRRLRAGDRPAAIAAMLDVHRAFAATLDELAEHRQEYAGLLSSPHLGVATVGQAALRALDDAGRLPVATLVEAGRAVLLRPEKKLVRAQLTWLATAAGRRPEDLPDILRVLGVGLAQESVDLADRALATIARYLPRVDEPTRDALRDLAGDLTGDIRRQAAEVLGGDVLGGPAEVPPGEDPAPFVADLPPALPPPIGSIAELTAEAVRLAAHPADPLLFERVADGLVRWMRTDPAGLRAALSTVRQGWIALLSHPAGTVRYPHRPDLAPPQQLVDLRTDEVIRQLHAGPPGPLLATPATVAGHVDPDRVLALLRQAGEEGWEPGRYDLTQALLRLPRTVDPAVRAGAAMLRTPAGQRFAGWLDRGGLPDPEVERIVVLRGRCCAQPEYQHSQRCGSCDRAGVRLTVAARAAAGPDLPDAPPGLLDLPGEQAAWDRCFRGYWPPPMALWPAVLPSHRELAAAHIQPRLAPVGDGDVNGHTEVLPALARLSGPFGPALALALAYPLGARRDRDRLPVVDALALLAARGELDGDLLGRELATLVTGDLLVLRRVVAGLTELSRAGAAAAVFAVGRVMVPELLSRPEIRPGTPDLLALTAAAADATGARGRVPEAEAVVAHGGGSRLVTEARRLVRALAG
jgi:hypothetical protein